MLFFYFMHMFETPPLLFGRTHIHTHTDTHYTHMHIVFFSVFLGVCLHVRETIAGWYVSLRVLNSFFHYHPISEPTELFLLFPRKEQNKWEIEDEYKKKDIYIYIINKVVSSLQLPSRSERDKSVVVFPHTQTSYAEKTKSNIYFHSSKTLTRTSQIHTKIKIRIRISLNIETVESQDGVRRGSRQ